MAIDYVHVLNSFVSTEGSNGFMTNYVYYSLLVVNTDGSRQILDGKADQISFLLPYIRTPMDELEELKETVRNLRRDINEIADQKAKYIVDSLFPIPDILGKNEVEAIELLENAGLEPVLLNQYPETTPKNGIVREFVRNGDNFKKVDLRVVHDVPEVTGLKMEDALEQLTAAGFQAEITREIVSDKEDGLVLECTRDDEDTLSVDLLVSSAIPETKGMQQEEAEKLLNAAGYETVIEGQFQNGDVGRVLRWDSIDESTVKLYVSIPFKYDAKHVDVKWADMQDSAGDVYSATATFDNKNKTLKVALAYTIGAKTKHQLVGVAVESNPSPSKEWFYFDVNMEPRVQNTLTFDLPFGKPLSELPKNIIFTLQTQFGIMKKKENVDLLLSFEW